MSEPKNIVRWLRVTSMLQSTLIFLVYLFFTRRIDSVASRVKTSLSQSEVATAQVNQVTNTVESLATHLTWIFLVGMALTKVSYAALEKVIKKHFATTFAEIGRVSNL